MAWMLPVAASCQPKFTQLSTVEVSETVVCPMNFAMSISEQTRLAAMTGSASRPPSFIVPFHQSCPLNRRPRRRMTGKANIGSRMMSKA